MRDDYNGDRISPSHRADLGEFLESFDWSHFATFTLRAASATPRIVPEFGKTVDRLATLAQSSVRYFYALEDSAVGHAHLHALIWGTTGVPVKAIEKAWKLGHARVAVYDPSGGAAFYVTKDLKPDSYDFFLSLGKPPKRSDN